MSSSPPSTAPASTIIAVKQLHHQLQVNYQLNRNPITRVILRDIGNPTGKYFNMAPGLAVSLLDFLQLQVLDIRRACNDF
jgi:hypothetical protein